MEQWNFDTRSRHARVAMYRAVLLFLGHKTMHFFFFFSLNVNLYSLHSKLLVKTSYSCLSLITLTSRLCLQKKLSQHEAVFKSFDENSS